MSCVFWTMKRVWNDSYDPFGHFRHCNSHGFVIRLLWNWLVIFTAALELFSLPENPSSCAKKARCQSTCKYAPLKNEHLPHNFGTEIFHLPSTNFSGDIRKRFSGEPLVQDWIRKTSMWMCQQQKFQWLPWRCRSLKSNCHLWCGIPGSWIRGNGKILSLKFWNYENMMISWHAYLKDCLMYRILHQIGMMTTLYGIGDIYGYLRTTSTGSPDFVHHLEFSP